MAYFGRNVANNALYGANWDRLSVANCLHSLDFCNKDTKSGEQSGSSGIQIAGVARWSHESRVFPCISERKISGLKYLSRSGVTEVSQQYIYLFSSLWCAFLCLSSGKVVEDIYAKKAPRLRVWTKKRDPQATHSSTTQDILTSWCHKVQMVVVKSRCDLIGLCVSCGCQLVSSISGLARKWATSEARRRDPGNTFA